MSGAVQSIKQGVLWTGGCLLLMVSCAVLGGIATKESDRQIAEANSPEAQRERQARLDSMKAAIPELSIATLIQEWDENPIRAESQWKGKMFRFNGQVRAVGQTTTIGDLGLQKEHPIITVSEGYSAFDFIFETTQRDAVANVNRGEIITFVCRIKGKAQFSNRVRVENCTLER